MDKKGLIAATLLALLLHKRNGMKKRRYRKYKTIQGNRNRRTDGFYRQTFLKMKELDSDQFLLYTRMTVPVFEKLLDLVTPHLQRKRLPDVVCPEERLALTLHFLGNGASLKTIAWNYHLGYTTVQKIVFEVCGILWKTLSEIYLKPPSTQAEWESISEGFYKKCNFPNCLGTIDGKRISIQGSQSTKYKENVDVILMAICDAGYNFTIVDIGAYGSLCDGSIFRDSGIRKTLDDCELYFPEPAVLPGTTHIKMPYVFVADEAFPLRMNIMRPYPDRRLSLQQMIFNYRLSEARRVIEHCFDILVTRWQILTRSINAKPSNVDILVKAIVCLHNYLNQEQSNYNNIEDVTSDNRSILSSVGRLSSNNASRSAYDLRNTLAEYFMSPEGEVPWQLDRVNCGTESI